MATDGNVKEDDGVVRVGGERGSESKNRTRHLCLKKKKNEKKKKHELQNYNST